MKYIFFLFALLSLVTAQASELRIDAYKAAFHVGKSVMACGTLKQVTIAPQQVYLNLDKPYPNQTLTILIWHNDYSKFTQHFGSLNKYVNKKYNLEKYEATKGMVHNKGELIDRNENERTSRDISYIQNNSNSGFGFSTFDNFHNNSNHIPTTNKQKMITEYDKIDEENYDEINYQIENQDQNNSYPNQFHNNLQQNSNLNQDENLKNINKYNNIINNNTISNNQFENNFTHAKNTEASKGSKKNSRLKNNEESKVSSILKVNNVTKNNVKSNSTNEINFKDSSDLNEVLLKTDLNSIKIASSKYLNLSNANLNLSMEDKLHLINNVDFDKVFYGAFKSDIDLKYKQSLYQNQSKTSIN